MTRTTARAIASGLMAGAGVAAAYAVARNPRLRRFAWRLIKVAVTTTVPAYLWREVQQAWAASGHRQETQPQPAGFWVAGERGRVIH